MGQDVKQGFVGAREAFRELCICTLAETSNGLHSSLLKKIALLEFLFYKLCSLFFEETKLYFFQMGQEIISVTKKKKLFLLVEPRNCMLGKQVSKQPGQARLAKSLSPPLGP